MGVLNRYYPPPVPLPMNFSSAFQLLSAICLSAQTTDIAVNQATKELWRRFPTAESTAQNATVADLEDLLRTIGLFRNKAKNLLAMSQILVAKHAGVVPAEKAALLELPGVGNKTAAVYLSQMHGVAAMAVDTHVHRLALRWGLTTETRDPSKVQNHLEAQFPRELWSQVQLQMIYFGREHCPAKNHEPRKCPICAFATLTGDALCSAIAEAQAAAAQPTAPLSPPIKKAKNILSYGERQAELLEDSTLVISPGLGVALTATAVSSSAASSFALSSAKRLDFDEENGLDEQEQEKGAGAGAGKGKGKGKGRGKSTGKDKTQPLSKKKGGETAAEVVQKRRRLAD